MPTPTQKIIDPTTAVKTAYEYLMKVSSTGSKLSNFRVEQVERYKKENYIITLGYDVEGQFGFDKKREYKDFKITKDGKVEWMKIHKL